MILVVLSKKRTMTQKLVKLKKKTNRNHSNNHITAQNLNKLNAENIKARSLQAKLATEADIAGFIKR